MRRHGASLLGILVSIVSLGAVAWWVSRQEAPRLPDSSGGWALLAVAVMVVATNFLLRGLRWHFVMRHAEVPHRLRDATGLTLVGYMGNNVLPARGGDVLKIGMFRGRTTARRREVLGTVLVERVLDAGVLAVLFVVLAWAGVKGSADSGATPAIVAAVLVGAAGALALYVRLRSRGHFERFAATVRPVAGAAKLFIRPAGIPLAALSLVIWCMDGLSFMLMADSLDVGLAFLPALAVIVLASLASAIPAAPGYLGTFDAAVIIGLKAAGIEGGDAVSLLVLARFIYFVPVTFVGLGVLLIGYGGARKRGRVAVEPLLDAAAEGPR
jgi:glycosyltransferase 2 family protein